MTLKVGDVVTIGPRPQCGHESSIRSPQKIKSFRPPNNPTTRCIICGATRTFAASAMMARLSNGHTIETSRLKHTKPKVDKRKLLL